jgi:nicotinamide-nucleotide amidase
MSIIRTAEILCVGTELLLGDIVNTNAAYLARQLADLGIGVYHQSVVGDHPERLKDAIDLALSRADLVITSGGLGPTYDDITREVVAAAFGR